MIIGHIKNVELCHDGNESLMKLGVAFIRRIHRGNAKNGDSIAPHLCLGFIGSVTSDDNNSFTLTTGHIGAIDVQGAHHDADRKDVEIAIKQADVGLARLPYGDVGRELYLSGGGDDETKERKEA